MSKRNLSILLVIFLSVSVYFVLPFLNHDTPETVVEVPVVEQDSAIVAPPEPKVLYGLVIDSMLVIEDKIKRNQNISDGKLYIINK